MPSPRQDAVFRTWESVEMTVSDVYSDIDLSRSKIYSFSVMNYHSNSCMIWQGGNFYSIPHMFRFLFTLQNHAMSDLTKKYGHVKSVHTMKHLVFSYFAMSRI